MTNDQLTEGYMRLSEQQAKSIAEHEKIEMILKKLQEDVESTKTLAEDVHIMAINIQNMQKTLEQTNKKVDSIVSEEFLEYKENKKAVKKNIISALIGALCTAGLGAIGFLIKFLIEKGGI